VGGATFAPTGCDDDNTGCVSTGSVVTAPVDGISGSSFSIMIWVKRERVGVDEYILTQGEEEKREGLKLQFDGDNTVKFSLINDWAYTSSKYSDDKGSWVHWGFTFNAFASSKYSDDSLVMKIFRGGITATGNTWEDTAGGTTSSSGPIYLGASKWYPSSSPFSGSMDELQVYAGRALTESEVATSYCGQVMKAGSLVMSLTFDVARNLGVDASGISGAADLINVTSSTGKVCVLDGTCQSPTCQSESSAGAPSVSGTDVSGYPFDFTPPYVSNTCLPSHTFPAPSFSRTIKTAPAPSLAAAQLAMASWEILGRSNVSGLRTSPPPGPAQFQT
jgi:hypothetical protein